MLNTFNDMIMAETKTFAIRNFPVELQRELKVRATIRGVSVGELLAEVVREWLKSQPQIEIPPED